MGSLGEFFHTICLIEITAITFLGYDDQEKTKNFRSLSLPLS